MGKGYLHAVETAATKEYYGDFNGHNVTLPLILSLYTNHGNGWHMIGNPFQSALIWNEGGDWALSSSVMAIAKILKNDGTGYEGSFN